MVEIWKDIIGYEGLYQVSSLGQVKSLKFGKERVLKGWKEGGGYYQVELCKNGKQRKYKVHRLVGIAFIPNPDNKPQINHIDGIKTNNRTDNLEWCTNKENCLHAHIVGLQYNKGEKNDNSKLTDVQVLEIRNKYATGKYIQQELADNYGVSQSIICLIINKITWKHI